MEFLSVSNDSISLAAQIINKGGIVAFPTETVYGLGANAYDSAAVVKVFEAKGRPFFDPLIVHIAAVETLYEVADLSLLNEETQHKLSLLIKNFWPGALSVVLPKSDKIPGIVTAGLPTAAFRFPANEAAQKLISLSSGAVAAPSANPFGALSPTKAVHVKEGLGEKADIILDGGPSQIGLESTVLDISNNSVKILRHGGVPKEEIEKLICAVQEISNNELDTAEGLSSPGLLKSHYAPGTPLTALSTEDIIRKPFESDSAWLFFDGYSRNAWQSTHNGQAETAVVRVLSSSGNLPEAAACLFETLHDLDKSSVSRIYAQFAPQQGIGAAINDRLRRAGTGA
jgi:L-threonylcarbamoyladenylate synthase